MTGHRPWSEMKREPSPEWSAALAAIDAIERGEWDRYLLRIRHAIDKRRDTAEYQEHIVAGTQ